MATLAPPRSRNALCLCGSGKRYKHCHGTDAAAQTPPEEAEAYARGGIEAHREGRLAEAERWYAAALAIAPDHAVAAHNLGAIALQRLDYAGALPLLERAARADPDDAEFLAKLGVAYAGVDRFDEALAADRRSLAIRPDQPGVLSNLGLALVNLGRDDEAIAAFDRALAIDPQHAKARWHRAMTRLAVGDRSAWDAFDARLEPAEPGWSAEGLSVPRYRGGDVRGMTLLVEDEQGFGDMLQFIRFASTLADRGARIVVRTRPPIAGLLRSVRGVADVVPLDAVPASDAWVPLMSLPALLGVDPQGEAPEIPYVHPDPARVAAMRARFAAEPGRRHVGIAWAGNAEQVNNRRRSCPLAELAPLLAREDIAWYSLQRGDGEDQIPGVPAARALRQLDERNDFDGKAALVGALDLVISVCTSNAHLAGALGRPTWILLAHVPDWRWGKTSATTAWYPTARLFRQPAIGDWKSVVRDVAAALDKR